MLSDGLLPGGVVYNLSYFNTTAINKHTAYVCIFHIQVLVVCCFCESSSLSKMFSLQNTLPPTMQHDSIGLSEHTWASAYEVINVGGEGEQELETKCINNVKILMYSEYPSKNI